MTSWLDRLNDEDRAFLKRFVLNSGSLKGLAQEYGISYPTVRLRLDRLIQKIELWDTVVPMSPFERHLRSLVIDGKLDAAALPELLKLHQLAGLTSADPEEIA